MSDIFFSNK